MHMTTGSSERVRFSSLFFSSFILFSLSALYIYCVFSIFSVIVETPLSLRGAFDGDRSARAAGPAQRRPWKLRGLVSKGRSTARCEETSTRFRGRHESRAAEPANEDQGPAPLSRCSAPASPTIRVSVIRAPAPPAHTTKPMLLEGSAPGRCERAGPLWRCRDSVDREGPGARQRPPVARSRRACGCSGRRQLTARASGHQPS
jgi:hypothetical protein